MAKASEGTPLKPLACDDKDDCESDEKKTFSSSIGLVLTCLGCAVGTGNIWRYPRVLARNAGDGGALCFIMAWFSFLFLWSIPMLLIEYSLGRFTRKGVILSFTQLLGPRAAWCGMWITLVNYFVGAYYTVITGWCFYYAFRSIAYPLPTTYEASLEVFDNFAQEASWPVLTMSIALLLTSLTLLKGVSTIEKTNLILAPGLFILLGVVFVWSMTRPNAGYGLSFLFTPDWATFKNPLLWVDAASQNAFDTGAGTGIFVAYAAYMSRKHKIVKFSLLIPMVNNAVSILCGMMMFSTVFSAVKSETPNATDADILKVLQESGPGSTGLTFIWLPQLLSSVGGLGRVIAVLFFVCLVCASLSSNIAMLEMLTHAFCDFGVKKILAVVIATCCYFVLGLGSALNLDFLTNQDFTWGIALLLNGLLLQILVILYDANKYREHIINSIDNGDWKAPYGWKCIVNYVTPVEAVVLLVWWMIDSTINDDKLGSKWYTFGATSLITVITQWVVVFVVVFAVNFALVIIKPAWFIKHTGNKNFDQLEEETVPQSAGK